MDQKKGAFKGCGFGETQGSFPFPRWGQGRYTALDTRATVFVEMQLHTLTKTIHAPFSKPIPRTRLE